MSEQEPTGGRLTITRITSNDDRAYYMQVELRFGDCRLRANVSMEDFAMALTGMAFVPCDVAVREFSQPAASPEPERSEH